jgi:hypothetical protein
MTEGEKEMLVEAFLRCTLFQGQFSSELAVVIKSSSGREFSLFAEKTDVDCSEWPREGGSVPGLIKVEVVDMQGDLCLVRLPQSTLENGQYVTVQSNQLNKTPDQLRAVVR